MRAYPDVVFLVLVVFIQTSQPCFCKNSTLASASNERERQALLKFRSSFKNTSGSPLASWEGNDCCQWKGVGCRGITGPVIKLDLSWSSQKPSDFMLLEAQVMNPSLVELEHLNHLDLSGIYFNHSPIPAFLGSMKQLRYLGLSHCGFTSRIPHHLGNLSNLHVLDVSYNYGLYDDDMGWVSKLSSFKYLAMDGVSLKKAHNLFHMLCMLPSLLQAKFTRCGITNHLIDSHGSINSTFHSNIEVLNLAYNSLDGSIPNVFQNMTSITDLHLSYNHLSSVPHWLGNFQSIVYLELQHNALEGPIPDAFQNMSSIRYLSLSDNLFSSVPHWLGNLQSLVFLDLSGNYFNGIQVSIVSILRNTCSIQILDLSRNMQGGGGSSISFGTGNLSGCKKYDLEGLWLVGSSITDSLPSWLGDLKSLQRLYLANNLIHGQIPSFLRQLSGMRELDLSGNCLTGTIPVDIGALSDLEELDLSNNQLKGPVPDSVRQLTNLNVLRIFNNSLEGTIYELHLCNFSNMQELDIGFNKLIVRIDSNWTPPFQLSSLEMASCDIGTEFPQWLQSQKQLMTLDLSNSNIWGTIPNWFHIGTNYWNSMWHLDLSNNHINGSIPNNFGHKKSFENELILKNNLLEGSIPESLCDLDMVVLDLSDNRLSGKIPNCWGSIKRRFSIINLSSNKLSGTIPNSFENLSEVAWLNLSNNSLHGELSQVLRNIQQVQILDLGWNQLFGMIPPEIGQSHAFQMLQVLRLSHNLLSGAIPLSLCQLPSLQILDLAANSLSSSIPLCLCSLRGMIKQSTNDRNGDAHSTDSNAPIVAPSLITMPPALPPGSDQWEKEGLKQVLKGLELDYTKNLKYLINIDLSNNSLTGSIPSSLTCLSGLIDLNLSHNKLSGRIPSKIGEMKSLESIDLSSNELYGSIPINMPTLTSLEFLNLTNNNFSGPIPKGAQFFTFGPSSFAGNPYLCGDPLSNACDSDHGIKAASKNKSVNDEGKEKMLFYFVTALGFIIGFWGVIGILVFKRRWRHALFQYVDDFVDTMYVEVLIRVAKFKKMINTK